MLPEDPAPSSSTDSYALNSPRAGGLAENSHALRRRSSAYSVENPALAMTNESMNLVSYASSMSGRRGADTSTVVLSRATSAGASERKKGGLHLHLNLSRGRVKRRAQDMALKRKSARHTAELLMNSSIHMNRGPVSRYQKTIESASSVHLHQHSTGVRYRMSGGGGSNNTNNMNFYDENGIAVSEDNSEPLAMGEGWSCFLCQPSAE